jgi:hypothetical protein
MTTTFHVCDHPELLTKDGICHLCNEFEGQEDALNLLED